MAARTPYHQSPRLRIFKRLPMAVTLTIILGQFLYLVNQFQQIDDKLDRIEAHLDRIESRLHQNAR